MTQFKIFFSNKIEYLYQRLSQESFSPAVPAFSRRLLIVPNPAIKSWLLLQLAKDPSIGIAAGIEIIYLPQALDELNKLIKPTSSKVVPSFIELMLAIEVEIKKVIKNSSELNANEQQLWAPLFKYLKLSEESALSRKSERRLIKLSQKLGTLFIKYGIYGGKMCLLWETEEAKHWQQLLWNSLYNEATPWTFPAKELSNLSNAQYSNLQNMQIYFFGISFLSNLHHNFLSQIAEHVPLNYFLLSPCRAFWSDLYSDRERHYLRIDWQKRGVTEAKQQALEEYMRERNSLLANFGRLGREMATQIEESNAQSDEDYEISQIAAELPDYENYIDLDIHVNPQKTELTLLEAVQNDMLLLRNPDTSSKIDFSENDHSIQLHVSSSPFREVENLYNRLLSIIDEQSICPSEIIVMAPDIMKYEPYIRAIFGSEESQLDWQLMDMQIANQSSLVQGFLYLINLSSSRWDASSIIQLFEYPEFRNKQKISYEELQQVILWIKESGIYWGEDSSHRNEMLQRDHCMKNMAESPVGTWDYGFSRLLYGLAMVMENSEHRSEIDLLPYNGMENSQGDLLGKFINLINSLREDLRPLTNGAEFTLKDWETYLTCICEAYFAIDTKDSDAQESQKILQKHIQTLGNASKRLGESKFSFTGIKPHLELLLSQETICYRENHLQVVRFCSMLPMRSIPAKAICLLGMEEGIFPKVDSALSLNLMTNNSDCDYCPSSIDYDRYLFLEVLLSARQYLLFSYSMSNPETMPSLVVSELMDYLDRAYSIKGEKVSNLCTFTHPFYPFDKAYFSGENIFQSFSQKHYSMAKSYYLSEKNDPSAFIPELVHGDFTIRSTDQEEAICIDLKQLTDFARNPLKSYFNKALGIYIKSDNNELKNEESIFLSDLENGSLRKAALNQPIEQIISLAEKEGLLPIGLFNELAKENLKEDVQQIKDNLAAQGVHLDQMMQLEFSVNCQTPTKKENGSWLFPALELDSFQSKVKIIGRMNYIVPQGLIVHGKNSPTDILKIWPQYLMLQNISNQDFGKKLFLTKDDKTLHCAITHPKEALEKYVHHYFYSLKNISFLTPEWVPDLLSCAPAKFVEKIKKSLKPDKYTRNYNEYMLWMLSHQDLPDELMHYSTMRQQAEVLYGDTLTTLFPKLSKDDHE